MNVMTMLSTKQMWKSCETGFVFAALFFFVGNPLKLLALSEASQSFQAGSNLLEQVSFLAIHLFSFVLLIVHRKTVVAAIAKQDKLILVSIAGLLLMIMLSTLWSAYPALTLRRGIALWGTTFFGVYFATCYSCEEQVSMLCRIFNVVVVLCLITAVLLPSYGVMSGLHAGSWRGIFLHKNGLGSAMVLGLVLFLMQFFDRNLKKRSTFIFLGLSAFLLLMSTSKNALLIAVVLTGLFPVLSFLKLRLDIMVPVLLGMTFVITLGTVGILENLGDLLQLLGKDPTLTGRTDIWPYVWEAIEKKIWLGYGYQGFWQGYDSDAAKIWYTVGWEPSHPHNGLLELLLIFGFLCTALFLLVFVWLYIRSIALIQATPSTRYFFPFIFFTYTLIANIGETKVLEYNDISWVLFIMLALWVAQPLRLHQPSSPSAQFSP